MVGQTFIPKPVDVSTVVTCTSANYDNGTASTHFHPTVLRIVEVENSTPYYDPKWAGEVIAKKAKRTKRETKLKHWQGKNKNPFYYTVPKR